MRTNSRTKLTGKVIDVMVQFKARLSLANVGTDGAEQTSLLCVQRRVPEQSLGGQQFTLAVQLGAEVTTRHRVQKIQAGQHRHVQEQRRQGSVGED